jgi:molybdopterin molybdotransferase
MAEQGKAWFIGLPGNPVSAIVTFMIMVRPFVLRLQGVADVTPRGLQSDGRFRLATARCSREFLRARMNERGTVELYPNQGPASVTSLCLGQTAWSATNRRSGRSAVATSVRFVPFSELLS